MFVVMLEDPKDGPSSPAMCVDIKGGWCVYEFVVFEESSPGGFYVAVFRFSETEDVGRGM